MEGERAPKGRVVSLSIEAPNSGIKVDLVTEREFKDRKGWPRRVIRLECDIPEIGFSEAARRISKWEGFRKRQEADINKEGEGANQKLTFVYHNQNWRHPECHTPCKEDLSITVAPSMDGTKIISDSMDSGDSAIAQMLVCALADMVAGKYKADTPSP